MTLDLRCLTKWTMALSPRPSGTIRSWLLWRIPLEELLRYPLVLADSQACEGHAKHVERVLRRVEMEPLVAERVASCDLMMVLVSAGFALGLAGESHIVTSREPDVVARPLALRVPPLTTYLLRPEGGSSDVLVRFIERVRRIESPEKSEKLY